MRSTLISRERPMWRLAHVAGGVLLGCTLTLMLIEGRALSRETPPATSPAFAAEFPPVRLTEGRLAGQMAYAPYPTVPDKRHHQPLLAGSRWASGRPRERALYHLFNKNLDRAIIVLEEAMRMTPGDALLLSDLSALYDERARVKSRPEDHAAALEMAERATALDSGVAEIVFNRALALEHLFLAEDAREGWLRYLEIEGSSRWAKEARSHLERLMDESRRPAVDRRDFLLRRISAGDLVAVARLTAANPEEAREIFETVLLENWTEAVARGQEDRASLRLAAAGQIASTLSRRGGDRIFLRFVAEMEAVAAEPSDSRKTSALVQSLRRYRTGRDKRGSRDCVGALRDLGAAEQGLRSIGSAIELLVSFKKTWCQFHQHDLAGAEATLLGLGKDRRLVDYPSLEARRQEGLAYLAGTTDDLDGGLASSLRALDLFRALGEKSRLVDMQNQIANILDFFGQPAEGWRYRYQALALTRRLPAEGLPIYTMLDTFQDAARASLAQRRPETALHFQTRVVSISQILQYRERMALALLTCAQIEAALGKQEAARRDFDRALKIVPATQISSRQELAARIDTVRSEIAAAEGRLAAIASEHFVPGHLTQQADFDFLRGDTNAGEKSLESALEQLERRREMVAPGTYQISIFDQAWPLYERMVALQLHLGRPEKDLEVLERFRARMLLDKMGKVPAGSAGAAPLGWQDLCRRLPRHTVVAVYAVVEGRLVIWLVRPSGVWMSPYQPDWTTVASRVRRLRERQTGEEEREELLEQLYGELVAPWKVEMDDGDRIVFVPTRELFGVPFAALLDSVSGRFLIQDHAVGVAPSASEFVAAVEGDRRASAKPLTSVLLVGDPVWNRSAAGQLPILPGSAREIELLSRVYQSLNTRVLTKAQATPLRVLASLDKADIVHFAVHALEDHEDPTRSRLLLSSSGSDQGELFARDILGRGLLPPRLVMLAACGTHAGPLSNSEGALSLAHSFLAAGVPAVVGSLWTVFDKSTARLSVRFHRELLRGADALTALRIAQLEEIAAHSGLSDWTWASFQVYGGVQERVPKKSL